MNIYVLFYFMSFMYIWRNGILLLFKLNVIWLYRQFHFDCGGGTCPKGVPTPFFTLWIFFNEIIFFLLDSLITHSSAILIGTFLIFLTLMGNQSLAGKLLNCEIYQRGVVSRIADTELLLWSHISIRPPSSIPGVGWVRRNAWESVLSCWHWIPTTDRTPRPTTRFNSWCRMS